MKVDDLRHGFGSLKESVADGWARLRRSATGALTRFRPQARPEAGSDALDAAPGLGWAMLGGDVFEDDRRVIVRLEVPGLARDAFDVQVRGDTLVVRGEKRFEREFDGSPGGRWRVLQCAYGSFERRLALPAAVHADRARASYRDGVLKVELPKAHPTPSRRIDVKAA